MTHKLLQATLQERLAELHLYEEICEHYAQCNISPEALRDWVAERMEPAQPPPQRQPLTDAEIDEAIVKGVKEGTIPWIGFKEDEQGDFTIPVISVTHRQVARAIEAKLKELNT